MSKNINRSSGVLKNAIPDLVGKTRTTAKALVESLGFVYAESHIASSTVGNDETLVTDQDIAKDTIEPLNTTVNVTWKQFGFTPFGFTPFSFAPFGAFGFTPFGAFGFTPFGAFGFTPFTAFGFTPGSRYCVDQDTLVNLVGPNDTILYKAAKDVQVGDEVWSLSFDEYIDESEEGYKGYLFSQSLTNTKMTKSTVENITPSTRTETLYFNGDIAKRFSTTERILIKRNSIYQYVPSGDVIPGDIYLAVSEANMLSEEPVTSIDTIQGDRTVYRFTVEPVDHLIAGGMVVHNYK